ncbi:MAG: cell division protein ZapA [Candidatus Dependentiae bacterium]|nr:cell division protein ZapA [Candidatus Dependentiae bacterium]
MIKNVKNYKVTIFGDQYSLMSDESEETIVQAAALVDSLMREIAQYSKVSDGKKIAVLTALRIASRVSALESEHEMIKHHKEKLIDQIDQELFSV